MLTGQNGILNRAQEAKEKTETAQEDEADKMATMEAMVQTAGTTITNPSSYGKNPSAQATADGTGKYFALPVGAKYIEGTVDTGVVVNIKESEFVWVPVDDVVLDVSKIADLPTSEENGTLNGKTYTPMAIKVGSDYKGILYDYSGSNSYLKYNDSSNNYQGGSTAYREPDIISFDTGDYETEGIKKDILQKEYNEMIESILKYKGFYVARYEAGLDKTTNEIVFKNASLDENNTITTSANNSKTSSWYGLYKKMKTFTTNEDKIVSSMIWGSQYDAMMNWMAKNGKSVGTDNSNIFNDTIVTGSKEDIINRIYDLYGCHLEWTIEASSVSGRVLRGGGSGSSVSPANYNYNTPDTTDLSYSSRATLWIK